MSETKGTDWKQLKVADRHGTDGFGQASDSTGTVDHIPKFNANGSLTDSGVPISGGGGPPTPLGTWVTDEIPVGALNNVNKTFAIANTPITGTESVFLNGDRQDNPRWVQTNGVAITFTVAPLDIDRITVNYQY